MPMTLDELDEIEKKCHLHDFWEKETLDGRTWRPSNRRRCGFYRARGLCFCDNSDQVAWRLTMNQEQFQSLVRLLLGAGGPLAAWMISKFGVSQAGIDAFTGSMIAMVGAVPVAASFLWGLRRHTTTGQL